ncbi:40-kDa huntingtin-associated protein [Frankliniella fusca]|uniref:40-kDa huntingtin-associated protein n=1 Tax=Frankliniella fusca TaxID=407009 RepID=A0AAE1GS01_9NEOP|nr:40-kDa huntingtin-associated protein [Frankliniella fusca]
MAEYPSNDILTQYRSISNKLKKRFLRKPNVQEASEQYGSLAMQCEAQQLLPYAGLCWQAVARCENELGHTNAEISALVRGGKLFLQAECKGASIGCHSAGGENVQAALCCYTRAGQRSQFLGPLGTPPAAGMALQLAEVLRRELDRPEAARLHCSRAADLLRSSPTAYMHCLESIASGRVSEGDYDGALAVLEEVVSIAQGAPRPTVGSYRDLLHKCEVSQVLLLLLLQPTPSRLPPRLAQLLERYTWGEHVDGADELVSEELFLLLQSLVMAIQSQDMPALRILEADLWRHLSPEQRTLLRSLARSVSRTAYRLTNNY